MHCAVAVTTSQKGQCTKSRLHAGWLCIQTSVFTAHQFMQDKGNSQHIVKQRNKRCWLTYLAFFQKLVRAPKLALSPVCKPVYAAQRFNHLTAVCLIMAARWASALRSGRSGAEERRPISIMATSCPVTVSTEQPLTKVKASVVMAYRLTRLRLCHLIRSL